MYSDLEFIVSVSTIDKAIINLFFLVQLYTKSQNYLLKLVNHNKANLFKNAIKIDLT